MVNKEILGGLKSALERGQSLKHAMMSFYNAGYRKEEIEESARALQLEQQQIQMPAQEAQKQIKPVKPIQLAQLMQKPVQKEIPVYKPEIPAEKISQSVSQPVVQRVSSYEDKKKSRNIIIIVLIVTLISLLGILGAIIFFRQELLALFGKLF